MDITSLSELRRNTDLHEVGRGFRVRAEPNWVVAGETWLSWTTLTRLAECCRELHWARVVRPLVPPTIDTTVATVTASFRRPVSVGQMLDLRYRVSRVGMRSYDLDVTAESETIVRCEMSIRSVFVTLGAPRSSTDIPGAVRDALVTEHLAEGQPDR
jgi:acyl-CoA thioesterase FadM